MSGESRDGTAKTVFGILGSGWRAETYVRIAKEASGWFDVCGLVTRSAQKGSRIEEAWGIRTFRSIEDLLRAASPSFVVVSLAKDVAPGFTAALAERGTAVLAETPPAASLELLSQLYARTKGARVQIAEQYFLQPMHAARLSVAASGKLGAVSEAQVSFSHGYHAVSLIRKTLGIGFENAVIHGSSFCSKTVEGPGRNGLPDRENLVETVQDFAFLDFGGKLGVYDFAKDQHRSWARFQRILVRGSRGEISNAEVRYLRDFRTPIETCLRRVQAGENGNLEGYHLKGVTMGEEWIYGNPFVPARLSDDEIAVASCLRKMDDYVHGGPGFYGLAEAAQDQYLALMVDRAVRTGEKVVTQTQPWSEGGRP